MSAGLARRPAVATVVVVAVLLAGLAAVLVPWSWVPGGHLVPMPEHELFRPSQVARAERYAGAQRAVGWTSYFLSLAVLLVLGLTTLGARLLRRLTPRRWWLAVPVAVLVVLLVERLVTLPFSVLSHRTDLHYDISRQAWPAWSLDLAKGLLVSWVGTTLVLLVVVAAARRSPRWWFAWAGAAALLLTLAGSFLYPVVVEPLFNRFTPMQAGPFKQSIFRLADREGVHIDDVLVADASRRTTTLNAYVSGYGSTRRVVVYDNLLKEASPAEARVVIAHELGHAKNDDVVIGTVLGSVAAVGAVALLALVLDSDRLRRRSGTAGAADPAAVALVLALAAVGTFAASPVQNTISRAIEARADRVSIETTHDGATFVSLQRRLALSSLNDPSPPWLSQLWWGSHPTVLPAVSAGRRPVSRLLVVTNDFPPRRGGIESFVLALCERMPPEDVVVYTASMPGDAAYDAGLAFAVHRDPRTMLLPTPAVARRVADVLRRTGCDRVVFGAAAPLGLLAPALRRAGAERLVAITHGHEVWWARLPGSRRLLRRIGDSVDVVTYVSEWCRDRIAPALSAAARTRMARLSPGVDPARFFPGCGGAGVRARLGIPPSAPVVVCTGRLVRRKGQDTLVRAWPAVLRAHPDAVLLLVGDGSARPLLERLVRRLGVTRSVVLTGGVAWDEVPAHTDAGDVFAMPCRTRRGGLEPEAWGIVFLEAQACGLPVVVGRSGGAPETLAEGHSGRVVEGVAEVADALVDLLARRTPRREAAAVSWTWDAAARQLGSLLDGSATC
jgi:phosphatidyl-myo-inositol dimannoside synthase